MLFLSRVFYLELESTKDGISLSELGKKKLMRYKFSATPILSWSIISNF